ncbi:hypothetical protein [Frigidibacter sp.]|uniref:hypothetical protein n=1 Tax=Frigidibacter sp. TaxID=2586418 RepID=UPI002736E1C8|nr:hypothetical protein [Frigidibacter sp.]MDP3339673.1 hypothetical protein [Frigidibacter sp.]
MQHASGREAYLVVLKHLVVAEDLAQIVAEFEPGAEVLRARDTTSALQAMRDIEAMRLAFLIDDRQAEGWTELVDGIVARGGRVVLIPRSEGIKAAPFADCLILERPFTTEMVQATLDAALRRHIV